MNIFKNNQAEDYHVFVSNSEWMKELGLATFTTGTLYDWWYEKDEQKRFMNRPLVRSSSFTYFLPTPEVFFIKAGTFDDYITAKAKVWRFSGAGKGTYEKMSFDESWTYNDGRAISSDNPSHGAVYEFDDLQMDDFDGVKFQAPTPTNDSRYIGLLKPERLLGANALNSNHGLGKTPDGISNIIACNDWVRSHEIQYPDKTDTTGWGKKELARYEFIDDIKTSKSEIGRAHV
jgi:hypothetical protein